MKTCELCRCEKKYNFHHFIPQTLRSNKWFKKRYTREEMSRGIEVCKLCHKMIHTFVPSEKELGRKYNTLELLLAHPEIKKYVEWKRSKARGHSEKVA